MILEVIVIVIVIVVVIVIVILGVTRDYLFLLPATSLHSLVLTPLAAPPVARRVSDEVNWESENLSQAPQ